MALLRAATRAENECTADDDVHQLNPPLIPVANCKSFMISRRMGRGLTFRMTWGRVSANVNVNG